MMKWLWRSFERHPWLWFVVLFLPLWAFPQIDITVASWFYDPVRGVFPARVEPFPEWIRRRMPAYLFIIAAATLVLGVAAWWRKRPCLGVSPSIAAYLLLALALGPGLVVNLILKDNWGRPRPSTIQEFGGTDTYVRALMISDQCDGNCSFSSGHGALGFWPLAFALLASPRWRPWAVAVSLAFGAMVGYVRIAQGGHFLSDVVFSALVTTAIIFWLRDRLLPKD